MRRLSRSVLLVLGAICVLLGLVGILVPILPTTPFLLLAAFFFARSSDRALYWLEHNRLLGAYLRNYRLGRGMRLRDKIFTLGLLWLTIGATVVFLVDTLWVRLLLLAVATGVTIHLARIHNLQEDVPLSEGE